MQAIATTDAPICDDSRYLRSNIYFCSVDEGFVFLDLKKQKYFSLNSDATVEFRRSVSQSLGNSRQTTHSIVEITGSPTFLSSLESNEVLTRIATDAKKEHLEPIDPTDSLYGTTETPSTVLNLLSPLVTFIASLRYVDSMLRRSRLEDMIDSLRTRRRRLGEVGRQSDFARVRRLVSFFSNLRIWAYRADEACLRDSLVLAEFLIRQRVPARLLIGVATKPFCAHAWAQLDSIVLNSPLETISLYSPILST